MTGSLDAQTVRDALTDATAWVDGTAQLASVEAALEALDGLVASVEALTSDRDRWKSAAEALPTSWADLYRETVERADAAEARVVALTAERDALERLVRRAVDEGLDGAGFWESSARSYLTSSRAAAKVPPVQAAPDSPREDASAPEGTAT